MTAMLVKHAVEFPGLEQKLVEVQERSKLSISDFAKKLGWARSTWYSIIEGKKALTVAQIHHIEKTFDVNLGIKVTIELDNPNE